MVSKAKKGNAKMKSTIHTKYNSVRDYIANNGCYEDLVNLEIDNGDDTAGWVIKTQAVSEDGYYDELKNVTLIIPDDWDGAIRKANNGWEWIGFDKREITADDIRSQIALDRTMTEEEIEMLGRTICNRVGIRI